MESYSVGFEPERKLGVQDFSRGAIESARVYVENKETKAGAGIGILVGLTSIFPEKINFKTINKSPELLQLCATVHVAVIINDYLDLQSFLGNEEGAELKSKLESEWKRTLEGIKFSTDLPEEKKIIIQSYMAGITLLDDLERANPNDSFEAIIKAKEMENAISLIHCSAMILDPNEINSDSFNLHEDVTRKSLDEKYGWLINGEPKNEVQRRLCAIHNIVMLGQVVDDYHDLKVDSKFGIRNIYASIIKETQDAKEAYKKLTLLQKHYQNLANKFGISNLSATSGKLALSLFKRIQYMFPDKCGGYRERLLK